MSIHENKIFRCNIFSLGFKRIALSDVTSQGEKPWKMKYYINLNKVF